MTADLYGYAPPNSEAFVRAWLLPLAASPAGVGTELWNPGAQPVMPLPYRAVHRVTGSGDLITDRAVVWVHTFAATYAAASHAATDTHLRMLMLADDPLLDVSMPDGGVANCESVSGDWPHEEPYGAEAIVRRFVSEYTIALHFIPTT